MWAPCRIKDGSVITEASGIEMAAIQPTLEQMRREVSRFEEGFPDHFEDYLFLYENYLVDRAILEAIAHANATTGRASFLFLPKEVIAGAAHPDLSVPNELWHEFYERIVGGLEFYLAAGDGAWLVWAYHEPCLHVASSAAFINAVKAGIPDWEERQSPWYEPGGIPVCTCGVWWHPGWGDWRAPEWRCPECSGSSSRCNK